MRLFVMILTTLLLSGSTLAECRERECMPNVRDVIEADSAFMIFYDSVFEIGTTWFVIFEYDTGHAGGTLTFEFISGPGKSTTLESFDEGMINDSISFSGSIFSNEIPHEKLYINFTQDDQNNLSWSVELDIFVNKPPADDLFYLWGGMTVFWTAIGAYVLYISSKLTKLRDK